MNWEIFKQSGQPWEKLRKRFSFRDFRVIYQACTDEALAALEQIYSGTSGEGSQTDLEVCRGIAKEQLEKHGRLPKDQTNEH